MPVLPCQLLLVTETMPQSFALPIENSAFLNALAGLEQC